MSDSINALTVVLDRDYRDDHLTSLKSAIRQLRGVVSVEPNVVAVSDHIARNRARLEIQKAINGVFDDLYHNGSKTPLDV